MFPAFPASVSVLAGLGFPRRIASLRDALAFLDAHPAPLRDEAYEATLSACRDAVVGKTSVEEAQAIFTAFARRCGILVEERTRAA